MYFTGEDGITRGIADIPEKRELASLSDAARENLFAGIERVKRTAATMREPYGFLFYTDVHLRQNKAGTPCMMQKVKNDCGITDSLYGGDTVSAYVNDELAREDMRQFAEHFLDGHTYVVRGNHDIEGKMYEEAKSGYILGEEEALDLLFLNEPGDTKREAGKTWYYFDRPLRKLRFVILDTNKVHIHAVSDAGTWCSRLENPPEQLDFLIDTLKSTPAGWRVVIAGHIPTHPALPWYIGSLTPYCELVSAYNRRAVVSTTFDRRLEGGEPYPVEADFADARGKVILFLSGHGHTDGYAFEDGCAYVEVNCDAFIDNGGAPYRRVEGNASEQVFDAILIDADDRIEAVRFGAGEDRTLA